MGLLCASPAERRILGVDDHPQFAAEIARKVTPRTMVRKGCAPIFSLPELAGVEIMGYVGAVNPNVQAVYIASNAVASGAGLRTNRVRGDNHQKPFYAAVL